MKYSIEEYLKELDKLHQKTCDGNRISKELAPFLSKLHDGLEIGDGITLNMYSDSHAATIVRRTGKTLYAQRDFATRTDGLGMSDVQDYSYKPNPDASIERCSWSAKRGCFMWQGKPISVGRHEYYDFTF